MLDTEIRNIIFKVKCLDKELEAMRKEAEQAEANLRRHKDMPIKLAIYEDGFDKRAIYDSAVVTTVLEAFIAATNKRVIELEDEIEAEFKRYGKKR